MFQAASLPSLLAFLVICGTVVAAFLGGLWLSARRESVNSFRRTFLGAVGTILWLSAIILVVQSGWLREDQRRLLFFAAGINAVSVGVGLSPIGRWLSLLPLPALVAFPGVQAPARARASCLGRAGCDPRHHDLVRQKLGHHFGRCGGDRRAVLPAIDYPGLDCERGWPGATGQCNEGRGFVVAGRLWLADRAQARADLSPPLCSHRPSLHRRRIDWSHCAHSSIASAAMERGELIDFVAAWVAAIARHIQCA